MGVVGKSIVVAVAFGAGFAAGWVVMRKRYNLYLKDEHEAIIDQYARRLVAAKAESRAILDICEKYNIPKEEIREAIDEQKKMIDETAPPAKEGDACPQMPLMPNFKKDIKKAKDKASDIVVKTFVPIGKDSDGTTKWEETDTPPEERKDAEEQMNELTESLGYVAAATASGSYKNPTISDYKRKKAIVDVVTEEDNTEMYNYLMVDSEIELFYAYLTQNDIRVGMELRRSVDDIQVNPVEIFGGSVANEILKKLQQVQEGDLLSVQIPVEGQYVTYAVQRM